MINVRSDRIKTETEAILIHWYQTSDISVVLIISVSTKKYKLLYQMFKQIYALHDHINST